MLRLTVLRLFYVDCPKTPKKFSNFQSNMASETIEFKFNFEK